MTVPVIPPVIGRADWARLVSQAIGQLAGAIGEIKFELTSDTTLVVSARGSDGITRSVTLTIS